MQKLTKMMRKFTKNNARIHKNDLTSLQTQNFESLYVCSFL